MAKIRVGNAVPEWVWFEDLYDEASSKLDSHTSSEAVYEDKNGFDIVLSGKNLGYSGKNITSGTVQSVQFLDDHGKTLISVTEGDYNAHKLSEALLKHGDLWEFMTLLTAGDDKIYGTSVGFYLNFGENQGNDIMVAGTGDTAMAGSEGNDTMKGGASWDTISFADTFWRSDDKQGIKLDATKGTIIDSWGDKDTFDNKFEQFEGSVYRDEMKGSNRDEAFFGFKGADIIDGGKGEDGLRYYRDVRYGGNDGIVVDFSKGTVVDGFGDKDQVSNIERVYGTAKGDTFIGDGGENRFVGLGGKDSYDGGNGTDVVGFQFWEDLKQHGVTVDLSKAKDQIIDDGFGNKETTTSIEAVEGSQFDDKITLGDGGWVWGDEGNDRLIAGTGAQWFGGGGGKDTFVFGSVNSMGINKNIDHIDDFSQGDGDRIDLSGIKGLKFEGIGNFDGGKEVRYVIDGGNTYIYGDADGDKKTDFQLELNGKINLADADFIL